MVARLEYLVRNCNWGWLELDYGYTRLKTASGSCTPETKGKRCACFPETIPAGLISPCHAAHHPMIPSPPVPTCCLATNPVLPGQEQERSKLKLSIGWIY
jgi:hypothetical protein